MGSRFLCDVEEVRSYESLAAKEISPAEVTTVEVTSVEIREEYTDEPTRRLARPGAPMAPLRRSRQRRCTAQPPAWPSPPCGRILFPSLRQPQRESARSPYSVSITAPANPTSTGSATACPTCWPLHLRLPAP
jgi:hypothetical protein